MAISSEEVKTIIENCKITVESAYKVKLDENFGGDEYFKRGFLFACQELTKIFLNTLSQFDITRKQ